MFDVIIVGGGPAGLSAALYLGRSRRRVLLCDTAKPRNAPSSAAHGLFSRDGMAPAQLLQIGREQLLPYTTVELRMIEVVDALPMEDHFVVTLANGRQESTRKLILTTGVRDELPAIEGFEQFWGRGVFHCPYCEGWEVQDQPLAIYGKGEGGLQLALLLTNWSRDLVLCSDGPAQLSEPDRDLLANLHISLQEADIARLEGRHADAAELRAGKQDQLERIVFTNGEILPLRGLFLHPGQRQHSPLPKKLGCRIQAGLVKVDVNGWTGIPHLYMAGDATNQIQQAALAVSGAVRAAMSINVELLQEDLEL